MSRWKWFMEPPEAGGSSDSESASYSHFRPGSNSGDEPASRLRNGHCDWTDEAPVEVFPEGDVVIEPWWVDSPTDEYPINGWSSDAD